MNNKIFGILIALYATSALAGGAAYQIQVPARIDLTTPTPPIEPAPTTDPLVLTLSGGALATGVVGAAYGPLDLTERLSISGGDTGGAYNLSEVIWSLGTESSLPSGMSLSAGGLIQGTPIATHSGTPDFLVVVRYSGSEGSASFSIPVIHEMLDSGWDPTSFGGTGSVSFSDNNYRATLATGLNGVAMGSPLPASGKWYWEVEHHAGTYANAGIGRRPISSHIGNGSGAGDTYSCGLYTAGGGTILSSDIGAWESATAGSSSANIWGFAYDAETRTLSMYRGNIFIGTCGVTGSDPLYARMGNGSSSYGGSEMTLRTHPSKFTYSPPSGYTAGLPRI